MMQPDLNARYRGALLGLACGDAVGAAVEFLPRGAFPPVTAMTGGGPFGLEPGEWTDDTSLALCLAASLLCRGGFDAADQLDRYTRWMETGYLSSNGVCFDIGMTTRSALDRWRRGNKTDTACGPVSPRSAGNGALMRLAPVPLFYADRTEAVRHAGLSSLTTHGAPESVDACRLFGAMLHDALHGVDKASLLFGQGVAGLSTPAVRAVAEGGWRDKPEAAIRGSGYVTDCLEAALWCFHTTDNYREAVLRAVNLGDDTDTTAAVCGQLAGAYYGVDAIPEDWRRRLAQGDRLLMLADQLLRHRVPDRSGASQPVSPGQWFD